MILIFLIIAGVFLYYAPSPLKAIGQILLGGGILLCAYAYFVFDITVEVPSTGNRVINFSLMDERRNLLLIAAIAIIAGLLVVLSKKESKG